MKKEDLIRTILLEISNELIENKEEIIRNSNNGVYTGISGISLFLFYVNRYTSEKAYYDNAWYFLDKSIEKINNKESIPSLCSGIAGTCWVINHLIENNYIDLENNYVLDDIDELLYNSMKDQMNVGSFDFLHGSTGIALYFLKRLGKSNNCREYLCEYSNSILENVEVVSEKDYCKIKLFDGVNKKYDLGIAHGLSSIIIILSKMSINNINSLKLNKLLKGWGNYLLSLEDIQLEVNQSMFPAIDKSDNNNLIKAKQMGWCYGDLNIGLALLNIARTINNEKFNKKAYEIFYKSSIRRGIKDQGIVDTCMCHGTSGIANIFRVLSKIYDENRFKVAQDYWMHKTLEFYYKFGLNGFSMFQYDKYKYCYSILEGTAGVGLTLLSYSNKLEMANWDEVLLLDLEI